MSTPVTIEELPYDPEFERLFNQAYRNLMWFSEHADELGVFKKLPKRTRVTNHVARSTEKC